MITRTLTYPENCYPKNMMLVLQENQKNFFYSDVQVRGAYSQHIKKGWKRKNVHVKFGPEDETI